MIHLYAMALVFAVIQGCGASSKPSSAGQTEHQSSRHAEAKKNFLEQFPTADLGKKGLSTKQLEEAWNHYDKNGDGFLNKKEMEKAARELVDMVPVIYEDVLRDANPDITAARVQEQIENDLPYLLPSSGVPGKMPTMKVTRCV